MKIKSHTHGKATEPSHEISPLALQVIYKRLETGDLSLLLMRDPIAVLEE